MSDSSEGKERGIFLSVMIVVLILSNLFGAFKLITSASDVQRSFSTLSETQIHFLAIVPLISIVGLIAIWLGRVWGIVVVSGAFAFVSVLDLSFGIWRHYSLALATFILLLVSCYLSRRFFKR